MDRTSLLQAVIKLDGFETGKWLQQQLYSSSSSIDLPHILLLLSAEREIEKAFPQGLRLELTWDTWSSTTKIDPSTLKNADLFIWGMSALNMFPGEFVAALEYARQERIPIWAIVVGIGRVSEKESFIQQKIPAYLANLPPQSEIFLYHNTSDQQLTERIRTLLAERGAALMETGASKRNAHLARQTKSRLQDERRSIQEQIERAERLTRTTQSGINSLKVLSNTLVNTLLDEYATLPQKIRQLREDLYEYIELEGDVLAIETFTETLAQRLEDWQRQTFENDLDQLTERNYEHLRNWCQEYTQELARFFQPAHSLTFGGDKSLQPTTLLTPEHIVPQAQQLFGTLKDALLRHLSNFYRRVQYDLKQNRESQNVAQHSVGSSYYDDDEYPLIAENESYVVDSYDPNAPALTDSGRQGTLKRQVHKTVEYLSHTIRQLTGTDNLYRHHVKERILSNLSKRLLMLDNAITTTIKAYREPLSHFLQKVLDEQANVNLDHVQLTIIALRQKTMRLHTVEQALTKELICDPS